MPKNNIILKSRLGEEIQKIGTTNAFEKLRFVVQTYNDYDWMSIVAQSVIIQRMSQQLIFVLLRIISNFNLYLHYITQAYV